ncbi:MAG: plasmid pRiA4b ORF-3 family protein [Tannerella sp.]|jgi:hypothetical protein|nr:plasmid pRiA4b ORF-3 family protein [Tannerella sp.]
MVYKFLLLSDEVNNFKREIQISSQATFLDLHNEILKATGYEEKQMYSFFICGNDWSKQTEITLIEMDTSSEEDSYIMEQTYLEDLLEEEYQKLLYVFDPLTERVFFIELCEIITGKELKKPVCSKSIGEPPKQYIDFDLVNNDFNINTDLGENFYGEDEFDDEDLEGLDEDTFENRLTDDPF